MLTPFKTLKAEQMYNVFLGNELKATGVFKKKNGEGLAIVKTSKKDENGNDRFEFFDDSHTFEAVSAPRPAPPRPAPAPPAPAPAEPKVSVYTLPKITLEQAKKMTNDDMEQALLEHESLRVTNVDKGYSWNKPASDVLQDQDPEMWKLLGSPDEDDLTPLRELVGLKDEVRTYMEGRVYPAGNGMRAAMARRTGGRRKAKVTTKKAAKKTCSPGYDVYNFRKTRKGVFYDCLPKKRTTRRRA
jgi:hypothetical protein